MQIEARLLQSMFPGSMSSEAECLFLIVAHKTQEIMTSRCVDTWPPIQLTADTNTRHSHKQQQLPLDFLSG